MTSQEKKIDNQVDNQVKTVGKSEPVGLEASRELLVRLANEFKQTHDRLLRELAKLDLIDTNKPWWTPLAHGLIGAIVALTVWPIARINPVFAGVVATIFVAGFKEGADIHDKRDTLKSSLVDIIQIIAGGLLALLVLSISQI